MCSLWENVGFLITSPRCIQTHLACLQCVTGQVLPVRTGPRKSKEEHVGSYFSREKEKEDAGSVCLGLLSTLASQIGCSRLDKLCGNEGAGEGGREHDNTGTLSMQMETPRVEKCFPPVYRGPFFLFLLISMELELMYNVTLVSTAQQSDSAIHTYTTLFWTSFLFRSPQSIEQSSLAFAVGFHQLSISYTVSVGAYMSVPSFQFIPSSAFSLSIHVFFLILYICVSISAL